MPRYRLNLVLETVGFTTGRLGIDLYGTGVAPSGYKKTIFDEAVEPGELLEISEEFDYLPFSKIYSYILSEEVEFLVRSISLERIYPAASEANTDPASD